MQNLFIKDKVLKMDCKVKKNQTISEMIFGISIWPLEYRPLQLRPRQYFHQPKTHTPSLTSINNEASEWQGMTMLFIGSGSNRNIWIKNRKIFWIFEYLKVHLLSGGVGCSHARVWVSLAERCWGEEADQQGSLTIHNSDIIAIIASSLSHPSLFTIIMNIWRRGWLTREVKVSFLVTQSQYIGRNDKLRSSSVGSYKSLLLPIYPLLAFVDPQKKTNWIAAQWNTNQLGNILWHTQAQIFTQVVQYLDI